MIPRSAIAPEDLLIRLGKRGAILEQVHVYDTVAPPHCADRARDALEAQEIDVVTFTSSSTVVNLVDGLGNDAQRLLRGPVLASIGPVTTRTAEERGLHVDVTASVHTVAGLIATLKRFADNRKGSTR